MLDPGTKLGPYEIIAPLGAGGMGEVYRSRDTRLGREVAIKVLPVHLSANAEVRTRFEREARTISGLNHPNICTLFDVGREGETDYLVMELIEGETLAERLRRGPLSTPEVVRLGIQIADALDRAHRAGVIHRDLKPGNVMITRSGAKLMDFGLARATGMAGSPSGSGASMAGLTQSPTVAQALTAEGTLIGTFQYMSPEQLEGREADARSDIWALGCVLYEMTTGRRAFEGRSQASLIAAILEREPATLGEAPSSASAAGGPPQGLDRLVRACLAKDPEERLQTAHDAKLQLQWIAEGAGVSNIAGSTPAPVLAMAPAKRTGSRLAWGIAALALLATVGLFAWLWPLANAPHPAYRFRTEPLAGVVNYNWPRVSPDGRSLVFDAQDSSGTLRAWLRPMDQTLARPILGSEGLRRAYWSPDSREIAFVAGGKIMRLPVTGGTATVVCEAGAGADLSWGSRGFILMDISQTESLRVVPARGGELQPASRIERAAGEVGSAWPYFLPDGEHFLFLGNLNGRTGGNIRLGKLGSLDSKLLGTSDGRAEYAPGGWVIYLRGSTLLAQKLDLGAGKLTGQPLTIAERVSIGGSAGHFSISRTGVLAYSRGGGASDNTLLEADRTGKVIGGPLAAGMVFNPAISPDGRRLLFQKAATNLGEDDEIWVRDLGRGTQTKLTFARNPAKMPVWSPDNRRFACVVYPHDGAASLQVGSADGLGARDSIPVPDGKAPMLTQWTTAGDRLVLIAADFGGLYVSAPDSADQTLRPIAGLPKSLGQGKISPDGRWLAYTSAEGGGAPQVYVQSLSGTPGRWQISTAIGYLPSWTSGGKELVFEGEGAVMAVDIETRDGFHVGTPKRLFLLPLTAFQPDANTWTCTEDGQRFFLLVPPRASNSGEIEVVTDFGALVNRK
ncbi:MAG: protein kinase [Candidatus Eisenbacteria bacterium]